MDLIIIFLLMLIIPIYASIKVNVNYKKYKKVINEKDLTGFDVARRILDEFGLGDIYVVETKGVMSDHYDSRRKTVRLSTEVFHGTSSASVAIAAHECGHAIQDKDGYLFLRIRRAMVPIVNFSSYAGYLAIVFGLFFSWINLIEIGIILEVIILAFQLVTLPVEFNASKRALKQIQSLGLLNANEYKGGKKMLVSAALTYVASVATAIIQILRLLLILGRRNRD